MRNPFAPKRVVTQADAPAEQAAAVPPAQPAPPAPVYSPPPPTYVPPPPPAYAAPVLMSPAHPAVQRKLLDTIAASVPGVQSAFIVSNDTGLIEASHGQDAEAATGYLTQVLTSERRALDAAGATGHPMTGVVFQSMRYYYALVPFGADFFVGIVADVRQANLAIMLRLSSIVNS
jgi:predicted regulator of Ras-like GTPase activity (Roadblock/LC7/MglB family)